MDHTRILFVAIAFLFHGASGELVCEELPVGMCSFTISSSGKRCLLETVVTDTGHPEFLCKTSEVMATNYMQEYVESEECITACGVDRNSVSISSDSLLESQFTGKLCSPECYSNCPNIIDVYYNMGIAEEVFLPELCKSQRRSTRRSAIQLQSSSAAAGPVANGPMSAAAYAPASSTSLDCAPAPL